MNAKLYIVRRRHAYAYSYDEEHDPQREAGTRLVRAFTDRSAAEGYLHALAEGRVCPPPGANPFLGFGALRRGTHYVGVSVDDETGIDVETFRGLADLTSFPEHVFLDWVRDCGLTPPEPARVPARYSERKFVLRDWDAWWRQTEPHMTDGQRAQVWRALDRLRYYEVVETELEE